MRIPVVRNTSYHYAAPPVIVQSPSPLTQHVPDHALIENGCAHNVSDHENCNVTTYRVRIARRFPLSRATKTTTTLSSSSSSSPAAKLLKAVTSRFRHEGRSGLLLLGSTEPHLAFFYIECVCNAWFSLELLVRLAVAPSQRTFLWTPINVIEFIASASFYLDFLMTYLKRDNEVLEFFR